MHGQTDRQRETQRRHYNDVTSDTPVKLQQTTTSRLVTPFIQSANKCDVTINLFLVDSVTPHQVSNKLIITTALCHYLSNDTIMPRL